MNLRIFAVGVEHYQDPGIRKVTFAENDATAFVNAWTSLAKVVDSVVLLSAKATHAAMWSQFKRFAADITVDDTVVIFYAGHGYRAGDTNYITCHDTQRGDIPGTSLKLEDIFALLRKSKSKRIMLFLDSCHSGMPMQDGMRSIVSDFTPDELKAFCKDSEFHVGFASCKVDEYSWPSTAVKHGIWTYCIVQALTGKAQSAFEKGELITGSSLADYLSIEVPAEIQKVRKANEVQTPCSFGNATKAFIVADLEPLVTQARAMNSEVTQGLGKGLLRGCEFGRIDKLSGFAKGRHRVPDKVYHAANSFVESIGADEVTEVANNLHDEIKDAYDFTRKQLRMESSDGSATITTPDFRVDITISQRTDDSSQYRLLIEVSEFKSPTVFTTEKFDKVFSGHCDTLVIQFEQPASVVDKIDEIEAIRALKKGLRYAADLSELTLSVPGSSLVVRMTPDEVSFSIPGDTDVKQLLEGFRDSLKSLAGSGVKLISQN